MMKIFLTYFVGILAIVDPAGAVPIWMALTKNYDESLRKSLSARTTLYVFAILVSFLFIGNAILQFFNISLSGMRIAGGIMMIISALEYLRGNKDHDLPKSLEEKSSIAFTPMAMPMLSGPGAIAVILGIGGDLGYIWQSWAGYGVAILAILLVCVITYTALYFSRYIQKLMGESFLHGMTFFMAFFLLCIGVQLILDSGSLVLRGILATPH